MDVTSSGKFQYNSEKDLLSVILLSYYSKDYLFEAIDSILKQDYKAIELIISDDGTKDFDKKLIDKYIRVNKSSNLLKYRIIHREKNIGTVRNINNALVVSHGEFVKLLGGDDVYPTSDSFSQQIKIITRENSLAVIGKVQQCDETMAPIFDERVKKSNDALPKVLKMPYIEARRYIAKIDIFPIANQAVCYKRDFFEEFGFCDEDYFLIEDTTLANRLLKMANKVSFIDEYTVNHRSKVGISTSRELFAPHRLLYYKDCATYALKEIDSHPELFSFIYRKENVRISKFVYDMALAKSRNKNRFQLFGIMMHYIDTMIYYILFNNKKFFNRIKTRIIG